MNGSDISDWIKSPSDRSGQKKLFFNIIYMVRHGYPMYWVHGTAGSRRKHASMFLARCLREYRYKEET